MSALTGALVSSMFAYITYSSTLDRFLGISENVTLPQMYQKRNQNLGCLQIYQKRKLLHERMTIQLSVT